MSHRLHVVSVRHEAGNTILHESPSAHRTGQDRQAAPSRLVTDERRTLFERREEHEIARPIELWKFARERNEANIGTVAIWRDQTLRVRFHRANNDKGAVDSRAIPGSQGEM